MPRLLHRATIARPRAAAARAIPVLRTLAVLLVAAATTAACFPDGVVDIDQTRVIVQVRDQNDAAVAGAAVAWWPAGLTDVSQNAVGATGTDGRIEFTVELWSEISVRITAPTGYTVASGQDNPMTFGLAPNGTTTVTFHVAGE